MIVTMSIIRVIWKFFMEIELSLIKYLIRKPEKRKPYYLRLHHRMYHAKCEGHIFGQSIQNCT